MPIDNNLKRLPGETDAAYRMRQYGMDSNNPVVDPNSQPQLDNSYNNSFPDLGMDSPEMIEQPEKKSMLQKLWGKRSGIFQGAVNGINGIASYNNEVRQTEDQENAMRNRFQQAPIWDYNNLYGNDSSIIKAEKGMEVRTKGSPAMPITIEGGEFLILADGTTEVAKGPKHKDGGIPTILPDKSVVYSAKLKPEGSKKTFAQLAKEQDYANEMKVLDNPFATPVSKTSAERMISRKQKTLAEIFQVQQMMNNDSNGEVMANGGKIEYESGGTYDLDEKEIKRLQKLGYKIEIL